MIKMRHKNCPRCNIDIGKLAVIKASLPSRIKCPHCKENLYYKPIPWWLLTFSLVVYIPLLNTIFEYFLSILSIKTTFSEIILLSVVAFLIWFPFELLFVNYLRKNCILTIRERS